MTNAQSKLIPKINHINIMGREITHGLRQAGIVSKYAKRVRVKVEREDDNDGIEFWNSVLTGKKGLYVPCESI